MLYEWIAWTLVLVVVSAFVVIPYADTIRFEREAKEKLVELTDSKPFEKLSLVEKRYVTREFDSWVDQQVRSRLILGSPQRKVPVLIRKYAR